MKKKFLKIITVFFTLLLISCGGSGGGSSGSSGNSNNSLSLGNQVGNSVSKEGFDRNTVSITATITPYENGFTVTYDPVSERFICTTDNFIIQGDSQFKFGLVADNLEQFNSFGFYTGYISSGANSSCTTYQVRTTWVMFSQRVGFNSRISYSVSLDDVVDESNDAQVFLINL